MKVLEYIEKEHNSPRERNIIAQGMQFMKRSLVEFLKLQVENDKAIRNNPGEDRNYGYLAGGNLRGKTVGVNSNVSLNGKNMAEIITINGTLKQEKSLKKKRKNPLSNKHNKSNVLLYRGANLDEKRLS